MSPLHHQGEGRTSRRLRPRAAGPTFRRAAEPLGDEHGQLFVLERVIRPEDAQLDFWEAHMSQMFGDAPHVLDGPDLIPVSGREPRPRTPGPYRSRDHVPVEGRVPATPLFTRTPLDALLFRREHLSAASAL